MWGRFPSYTESSVYPPGMGAEYKYPQNASIVTEITESSSELKTMTCTDSEQLNSVQLNSALSFPAGEAHGGGIEIPPKTQVINTDSRWPELKYRNST